MFENKSIVNKRRLEEKENRFWWVYLGVIWMKNNCLKCRCEIPENRLYCDKYLKIGKEDDSRLQK
jgi:hypothetical protein